MIKSNNIFNVFIIGIGLLGVGSIHGMNDIQLQETAMWDNENTNQMISVIPVQESHNRLMASIVDYCQPLLKSVSNAIWGSKQESSQIIHFQDLPDEVVKHILFYAKTHDSDEWCAIVKNLKMVLALTSTNKYFQRILDCNNIGKIFASYTNESKNKLLESVIFSEEKLGCLQALNATYYPAKCRFALGLINAGADLGNAPHDKLIEAAMHYDDLALITMLCDKKKIDLYRKDWIGKPFFFYAKTVQMAELCEKNGINLHFENVSKRKSNPYMYPNILWAVVRNNSIPSSLLRFYLDKGVAIQLCKADGQSLLHALARSCGPSVKDIDDFINKGKLLLEKDPNFINALNKQGQTPLDVAEKNKWYSHAIIDSTEAIDQLITFLKEQGGKRSLEEDSCVLQ